MRLVLSLGLVVLLAVSGVGLHAFRDRAQFVDAPRLQAALSIFRPSERNGTAKPVDAAGLSPERSTRADPAHCRSLALLNSGEAQDGGSWQGVNGSPVQPVTTLTPGSPPPARPAPSSGPNGWRPDAAHPARRRQPGLHPDRHQDHLRLLPPPLGQHADLGVRLDRELASHPTRGR